MRLVKIFQVILKGIGEQPRLRRHQLAKLQLLQIVGDENPFHLPVNGVGRRISLRIRTYPTVVVNGCVQRIRRVANVVTQPSCIKNGIGLGKISIAMLRNGMAVFAKGDHQPLEDLGCNVGLQPDPLWQKIIGMPGRLLAPGFERAIKAVTVGWKVDALDHLEIDEVVRLLRSLQGRLGSLPPAIRLGTKIGQLSFCLAQEGGNVGRQLLGCNPVDRAVAFIAPRPCRRDKARESPTGRPRFDAYWFSSHELLLRVRARLSVVPMAL
jgi:hypothetical protein